MKPGPRKTPTLLRSVRGNPSKRAMPKEEPQGQGDLWAPPEYFDEVQREQWNYALDYAPPGLLTATDREVLAIWCVAAVEHARAVQAVRRMGQVVKTKDGNAIQNPYLAVVNKQAMIMLRAGGELGFSPASRASLGAAGKMSEYTNGPTLGRRAPASALAAYLEQKPDTLN